MEDRVSHCTSTDLVYDQVYRLILEDFASGRFSAARVRQRFPEVKHRDLEVMIQQARAEVREAVGPVDPRLLVEQYLAELDDMLEVLRQEYEVIRECGQRDTKALISLTREISRLGKQRMDFMQDTGVIPTRATRVKLQPGDDGEQAPDRRVIEAKWLEQDDPCAPDPEEQRL